MRKIWMVSSLLGLATGCLTANVGTSGTMVRVPADAGATCVAHCDGIGMDLGAVAIMANEVGCICEPRSGAAADNSAAVSAGMATIAVRRQQEQQRQAAQQAR